MVDNQWTPFLHEIGTIIAGTAAVIAAVSSLKNGRTLNGHVRTGIRRLSRNRKTKKISNAETKKKDWFKPPTFQ